MTQAINPSDILSMFLFGHNVFLQLLQNKHKVQVRFVFGSIRDKTLTAHQRLHSIKICGSRVPIRQDSFNCEGKIAH